MAVSIEHRVAVVFGVLLSIAATDLRADTELAEVEATVGITTGLIVVATSTTPWRPRNATIDWGEGGGPEPALLDCRRQQELICEFLGQHTYAETGKYTLTLRHEASFFNSVVELTSEVTVSPVGDFVIVSVGDSNASGEGNPVRPRRLFPPPLSHPAYWDDDGCRRSSAAGPALAAAAIRQAHPGESVTFLHLACTGAVTSSVVDQIQQAGNLLSPETVIDALLISVGGNDLAGGLGSVVMQCLGPLPPETTDPSIDCSLNRQLRDDLQAGIASLPAKYAELDRSILALEQTVSAVLITEYADPTRDHTGEFPSPFRSALCTAGFIKHQEWEFLHDNLLAPLNDAVATAAQTHGWQLVGGLAEATRTHGYCASAGIRDGSGQSFIVKAPESILRQGNFNGTAHPDGDGQQLIRDAILATIDVDGGQVSTLYSQSTK